MEMPVTTKSAPIGVTTTDIPGPTVTEPWQRRRVYRVSQKAYAAIRRKAIMASFVESEGLRKRYLREQRRKHKRAMKMLQWRAEEEFEEEDGEEDEAEQEAEMEAA
jgi:hypothetical protein